ncbi:hypothetical protein [Arenibacter arenosicollis]|nr:hypothetical protein [Arenibacter arenosicollis]
MKLSVKATHTECLEIVRLRKAKVKEIDKEYISVDFVLDLDAG